MKKYKFLEHTADVMFEAHGDSLEDLFTSSALATEEIMVNLESLSIDEEYYITIESETIENLLYDFLSELIFIKDTENLLFKNFKIIILNKNGKYELSATCEGEKLNPKKHNLGADAKAVTKHQFSVEKKNNKWHSKVIVDI